MTPDLKAPFEHLVQEGLVLVGCEGMIGVDNLLLQMAVALGTKRSVVWLDAVGEMDLNERRNRIICGTPEPEGGFLTAKFRSYAARRRAYSSTSAPFAQVITSHACMTPQCDVIIVADYDALMCNVFDDPLERDTKSLSVIANLRTKCKLLVLRRHMASDKPMHFSIRETLKAHQMYRITAQDRNEPNVLDMLTVKDMDAQFYKMELRPDPVSLRFAVENCTKIEPQPVEVPNGPDIQNVS